jgi:F0F1-type ATP synthase membrane subunit b/b'
MEILRRLGELFLQAVPTILVVFLFYLFLRAAFFRPMERVLNERRARTAGVRRAAESTQAAAQEKLRAYQDAMHKARTEVYAEQDSARRAVLDERAGMIRAARSRANEEVRAAKDKTATQLAAVRAEVEASSAALAEEIAQLILERRPPGPRAASEAR